VAAPVPDTDVDHRLLLIGDAGHPDPEGEPVLRALAQRVLELPDRTTVLFLGDNVYETGMPDDSALEGTVIAEVLDEALLNLYESRRDAERRLGAQMEVVRGSAARAIFVPGNHDWDQLGVGGWERVLAQGAYLRQADRDPSLDVAMLPEGGCPGPVGVELGATGRLVVLDTQWFLDPAIGGKPAPGENPTGCAHVTADGAMAGLRTELEAARAEGRVAIVAGHHPLLSRGPHGGHFAWHVHLFPLIMLGSYVPSFVHWIPLPAVGSFMVGVRACCSPNAQDLPSAANRALRTLLLDTLESARIAGAPALLYAAGHEHSLQLFLSPRGPRYAVVSGLGSREKASYVGSLEETLFADAGPDATGYFQVDLMRSGRVRLAVFQVDDEGVGIRESYARDLRTGAGGDGQGDRAVRTGPDPRPPPARSATPRDPPAPPPPAR